MAEEQTNETQGNNTNSTDERLTALEQRLEQAENEKLALKMDLDKAHNELYSDEYVEYLSQKNNMNKGQQADPFQNMSDEQLNNMGVKDIINLTRQSVLEEIRTEQNKQQTKQQRDAHRQRVDAARKEIAEFGKTHPDLKYYLGTIKEIADESPKLTLPRLYALAKVEKGDLSPKDKDKGKEETKPKGNTNPDTKPTVNEGVAKDDGKNKSLREVIAEEYSKTRS